MGSPWVAAAAGSWTRETDFSSRELQSVSSSSFMCDQPAQLGDRRQSGDAYLSGHCPTRWHAAGKTFKAQERFPVCGWRLQPLLPGFLPKDYLQCHLRHMGSHPECPLFPNPYLASQVLVNCLWDVTNYAPLSVASERKSENTIYLKRKISHGCKGHMPITALTTPVFARLAVTSSGPALTQVSSSCL